MSTIAYGGPDRRVAAEERAKELNLAYTTLSRPDSRRQYDTQLRASMVQEQIMGRYVGGFGGPDSGAADPFAPRRPRRSDRRAHGAPHDLRRDPEDEVRAEGAKVRREGGLLRRL